MKKSVRILLMGLCLSGVVAVVGCGPAQQQNKTVEHKYAYTIRWLNVSGTIQTVQVDRYRVGGGMIFFWDPATRQERAISTARAEILPN